MSPPKRRIHGVCQNTQELTVRCAHEEELAVRKGSRSVSKGEGRSRGEAY